MGSRLAALACAMALAGCAPAERSPAVPRRVTVTTSSPEALALYREAQDLFGHFRYAEAARKLKAAVAADPSFWLARAILGRETPGPEGMAEVRRAVAMSARLPMAERLLVHRQLAWRLGTLDSGRKISRRIAELAPDDLVAQLDHAIEELMARNYLAATAAYRRTLELDPRSGAALAGLSTALGAAGAHAEAIEVANRYVAIYPNEPNSYDTLAEAQLNAGQLEAASASFRKAALVQPSFWVALQGLAIARLYAGDYPGAREAARRARAIARVDEQLKLDVLIAYIALAAGSPEEALALVGSLQAKAGGVRDPYLSAWAPLPRAGMLIELGRYEEALADIASARKALSALQKDSENTGFTVWLGYGLKMHAEARLGRDADLSQSLALAEAESARTPANLTLRELRQYGRGLQLALRGDLKGARDALSQCMPDGIACRWELYRVQRRMGDGAGADGTRRSLMAVRARDTLAAWGALRAARDGGWVAPPL